MSVFFSWSSQQAQLKNWFPIGENTRPRLTSVHMTRNPLTYMQPSHELPMLIDVCGQYQSFHQWTEFSPNGIKYIPRSVLRLTIHTLHFLFWYMIQQTSLFNNSPGFTTVVMLQCASWLRESNYVYIQCTVLTYTMNASEVAGGTEKVVLIDT